MSTKKAVAIACAAGAAFLAVVAAVMYFSGALNHYDYINTEELSEDMEESIKYINLYTNKEE